MLVLRTFVFLLGSKKFITVTAVMISMIVMIGMIVMTVMIAAAAAAVSSALIMCGKYCCDCATLAAATAVMLLMPQCCG